MREADNKSVVGVYVVRTSSLNDMHSCQLFRKAASFSSLVLLSSSVSMANLSCLLATTFSSLRFLSKFTSLQSFESGQALFLVVIGRAKRAPHWGVQSRFRVIYICRYVCCMSNHVESRESNTCMLKVSIGR